MCERSDGRLKSLFWPSVQSGADVDYLGAQGYWICAFIAVVSFGFSLLQGRPFLAITLLLFFYFGGVGVRQRDPLAAGMVFLFYAVDTVTTVFFMVFASPWGMIVFRIFVTALLLSNVRATWIADPLALGTFRRRPCFISSHAREQGQRHRRPALMAGSTQPGQLP